MRNVRKQTPPSFTREGDSLRVILSCGATTLISKEDEWVIFEFPAWYRSNGCVQVSRTITTGYGTACETYLLHRLITRVPVGRQIDHKNRDQLDNRRSNLRIATPSQNSANKVARGISGLKGVHDTRRSPPLKKPWAAHIQSQGKKKNLGYFATAEEAGRAYDAAALELFGEFAVLNFPE